MAHHMQQLPVLKLATELMTMEQAIDRVASQYGDAVAAAAYFELQDYFESNGYPIQRTPTDVHDSSLEFGDIVNLKPNTQPEQEFETKADQLSVPLTVTLNLTLS